ncbi:homocysteine S-methyltransferase family protein [Leucobacter sp. 1207-22]|uniref:homocysteine S-methyltransferase family protein n=1 Tax=Leucobacter sp. 1207-22 TaxID=2604456 RepID=UPI004063CBD5
MPNTIADGGIETALEERLGQSLREFAAFELLETEAGRAALAEYYTPFIELAIAAEFPIALDTPTWRASSAWGDVLGYDAAALARLNRSAVEFVREVASNVDGNATLTVGGCIGPRADEPVEGEFMTAEEAEEYHLPQVRALAAAGANRIGAVTMGYVNEAVGIVRAATRMDVPVVVSFGVGADGLLADGTTVSDAITEVDRATNEYAKGFMVNCAHPSEAAKAIGNLTTTDRLAGFRLNAARHDDDTADSPEIFAAQLLELRELAPRAQLFGGCCGTDVPHIAAVAAGLAADGDE